MSEEMSRGLDKTVKEEFDGLGSDEERVEMFVGWSVEVQKLLVGLATFADSAIPVMAKAVAELDDEEFGDVMQEAGKMGFVEEIETDLGKRVRMDEGMREFVNGPLMRAWEEQRKNDEE